MQALTTTGAMIDGRSNPRAGGAHGATFARPATQAAQLPAEALHTLELPGDAMRRRVQGTTCSVNTSGKGRACKGRACKREGRHSTGAPRSRAPRSNHHLTRQ